MKSINVMILGLGPHAKNVHIPLILKLNKYDIRIKSIITLKSEKKEALEYLKRPLFEKVDLLFIDPIQDSLCPDLKKQLNTIVNKHKIEAVIISTEPSTHKILALWALENNLHICMDKPITTIKNASNDVKAAMGIYKDFQDLSKVYLEKKKEKNILFCVNAHRRYHPGYEFIISNIKKIIKQTNCPITSIQIFHGDGQWRTPNEIVDMDYHGYNKGYGKNSHSGYHLFDLIAQLVECGIPYSKKPNSVEMFSFQNNPYDYLHQITLSDYNKMFDFTYKNKYFKNEIFNLCRNYGEIDSFSQMQFKKDKATICTVQLTLNHNSCSQRGWPESRKDIFRGYGRVKHESIIIQQGPFQCIQLNSYQNKLPINENLAKDHEIGGLNHFDVYIYKNAKFLGGKIFEKFSIDQLVNTNPNEPRALVIAVKKKCLKEFFQYILKDTKQKKIRSDLITHRLGVLLMSSVYEASIKNELIKKNF